MTMPAEPSKSALVVRGGWEGHHQVEATDRFIPYLQQQGYAIRIQDSPEVYADVDSLLG